MKKGWYLLLLLLSVCVGKGVWVGMFASMLYPKVVYNFHLPGGEPPYQPMERLAAGDRYPQTFFLVPTRGANFFKYSFGICDLFVRKPYDTLYIHEMSGEWEGKTKVFMKDKRFTMLPENYLSDNGWYWRNGVGAQSHKFLKEDFHKLFQKEPGDRFSFRLTLIYSFEDEEIQTQIIDYEVVAAEGRYVYQGP
jgi:hypothetical protein